MVSKREKPLIEFKLNLPRPLKHFFERIYNERDMKVVVIYIIGLVLILHLIAILIGRAIPESTSNIVISGLILMFLLALAKGSKTEVTTEDRQEETDWSIMDVDTKIKILEYNRVYWGRQSKRHSLNIQIPDDMNVSIEERNILQDEIPKEKASLHGLMTTDITKYIDTLKKQKYMEKPPFNQSWWSKWKEPTIIVVLLMGILTIIVMVLLAI